jgi:predicted ribonuclease YlaK
MPLIFNIPTKPQYKNQVVFDVSIPLLGELTVNEAIAVDKAIVTDIKPESTNTEWMIVQVTAWLEVRLNADKAGLTAQLYKSKALIDALWTMFVKEREGIATDYEVEEVTEGKEEEPTEPLKTSRKSGTKSISNSHQVALAQNLAMDLDSNE